MSDYLSCDGTIRGIVGDCLHVLRTLPDQSVHCCVTSPPYYGLRSYLPADHPDKQFEIGTETTPDEYIAKMVAVFAEVRRILRDDGVIFINIGDSYASGGRTTRDPGQSKIHRAFKGDNYPDGMRPQDPDGIKPKDLLGIPYMLAFALRADGWYWRDLIVWAKPNCMPGSQDDRCTSSHESVLMLSKSARYFSDFDAIKTPPRESSMVRLAQDVQAQAGSHRANGGAKTNGTMKAVGGKDKQRGHSRKHAGFNERWDAMERAEQMAQPAMMRNVWFIAPATFDEAHFAVMPEELARRCILAGSPVDGVILDPFGGAGTTPAVAARFGRRAVFIELNPDYMQMAAKRIDEAVSETALFRHSDPNQEPTP